jgi:hypothetical protein
MAKSRNHGNRFKEFAREFGSTVLKNVVPVLAEGAEEIVELAKETCPVGKPRDHSDIHSAYLADMGIEEHVPGALRDSIVATPNRDGTRIVITAGAKNPKGMPYGQFVEFDPRIKKPFMYPSMDAKAPGIREKLIKSIQEAAKENAQSYS